MLPDFSGAQSRPGAGAGRCRVRLLPMMMAWLPGSAARVERARAALPFVLDDWLDIDGVPLAEERSAVGVRWIPGVDQGDSGSQEVFDVTGGEHGAVDRARGRNLSVGDSDWLPGSFTGDDD